MFLFNCNDFSWSIEGLWDFLGLRHKCDSCCVRLLVAAASEEQKSTKLNGVSIPVSCSLGGKGPVFGKQLSDIGSICNTRM